MNKRLFFIILFTGLICFEAINAQWVIERCPSKCNLNAISFVSPNSGWIVGDEGTILYKSDFGWKYYEKLTDKNLYALFMIDKNDGWAVGAQGTIIHYNGKTWESVSCPTQNDLLSVSFKDSDNGTAVGTHGTILIYKNGNWSISDTIVRGDLFTVFHENDNTWIGAGLECVNIPIMKMVYNKGATMAVNTFETNASINSLVVLNPDNGWAVGSPSTLLHFNGQTWEKPVIDCNFPSLKSVFFCDENKGICVGYEGTILTCTDNIWKKEDVSTAQDLNGATIVDNICYTVGDSGTILMKNLEANSYTNNSQKISDEIQLYPNPCNEYLNVIVPSNSDANLIFSIINPRGMLMKQKIFNVIDGNFSCKISTGDLKNGTYILNTNIGSKVISSKFIVNH